MIDAANLSHVPGRLLVSVRDLHEADLALAAGVDLIDIKEPARGSLGSAGPTVITDIVQRIGGRVPTSAALGELLEYDQTAERRLPNGLSYAKLGMAGCGQRLDWPRTWARVLETFPKGIQAVAVVYADWSAAQAPAPSEILQHAVALGCRAVLVDTFDKSHGGLLDHWGFAELEQFMQSVHESGLVSVLAGSLSLEAIPQVLSLQPHYVAVRGAACRGARTQQIDPDRLTQLVNLVHSS
jgi:uncharacterized protein (UPF0264 family)